MKQFTKVVFATMIGTFMALGFLFFVGVAMIAGLASTGGSEWDVELGEVKDKSVLHIKFDGALKDHVIKRDLLSSILKYDSPPVTGLYELSLVLEKAAKDKRITGVLLQFDNLSSGYANAENLRRLLKTFKSSGKFVMAYSESYSELDYLVASVADEIVLYPKGYFEWDGVFSKLAYFAGTFEKLNVVPQIFRVGKYKSAIEPYINKEMSEASREQVDALLEGVWSRLLSYAAEKTGKSNEDLDMLAAGMEVMFAKDALENGFVSLLASFEEVDEKLKELSGADEKTHYVSWRSYYNELDRNKILPTGNKVALVFAEGAIQVGEDEEAISSRQLSKVINEIRRDEDVKAVVLRVNSPGGSPLASDVIWTSTQWLKDAKPVVTSFGNVAASGGYYMSAGSQVIFAEPTTITGSIGVFGLTFATQKFWNDKIGFTFDTAKSHPFADMQSLVREYNAQEKVFIQTSVDQIYQDFLEVVTSGRPAFESKDQTHEVAQGRVWIGSTAKEIGLVDEIGGMQEAIAKAAEMAKLEDYSVEVYPKELSAFEHFVKQMGQASILLTKNFIPEALQKVFLKAPKSLDDNIQMRLPVDIEIR